MTTARRPTVRDLLLATALLAAGCAWARAAMDTLHESMVGPASDRLPYDPAIRQYGGAFSLVVGAAVLLFFQLRRPRPGLRRLARQPGVMACLAVALGLALSLALATRADLVAFHRYGGSDYPGVGLAGSIYRDWLRGIAAENLAPPIAAAWLALACSGRWRWGRGLDAAGVLLGIAWLAWPFVASWH